MNNENLLYIEDVSKRKLFYRFTPAAIASNFVPLIVILDEGAEAPNFEYKMWNVLSPLNNFSDENRGSCWLGEKGDFFVKDLLQELISQIADEYECEDHIYLYGSYGAILHGMLSKAHAVYVNVPQIRLEDAESIENDLRNFLNPRDSFPIFYLCHNTDSNESTSEDETPYFVDTCKKHGISFHLDKCVKSGDDESQTIKEVLDMFERMNPEG